MHKRKVPRNNQQHNKTKNSRMVFSMSLKRKEKPKMPNCSSGKQSKSNRKLMRWSHQSRQSKKMIRNRKIIPIQNKLLRERPNPRSRLLLGKMEALRKLLALLTQLRKMQVPSKTSRTCSWPKRPTDVCTRCTIDIMPTSIQSSSWPPLFLLHLLQSSTS